MSNTALIFDAALRASEYLVKLNRALSQAQAEGRDISDEEVKTLIGSNDAKIEELLSRE